MLGDREEENGVRSLERDSGICDHGMDEDGQRFDNLSGLSDDLRFLSGMPELCDVMFVVGEEREAVYGVKAVLAIRSRVFFKMLYGPRGAKWKVAGEQSGCTVSQLGRRLLGKTSSDDGQQSCNSPKSLKAAASFSSHGRGTGGGNQKTVVRVAEFDPDVFKQLLEYVHTGTVTMRPKTLLGLLNAADHFAMEELRRACAEYSRECINIDTVCSLLVTAERYIQYKSSKIFVQRVLDFVDKRGDDVLRLAELVHLPRHVIELILSREELNASEMIKFQAALRWSRHYALYHPHSGTLARTMAPFTHYIAFHLITAQQLMHEIRPLDVVPDRILMNALAYQADPTSIDKQQLSYRPRSVGRADQPAQSAKPVGKRSQRGKAKLNSRACSVDRNVSKASDQSSNCSDPGFQDDCYYYTLNQREAARDTPGPTVVTVDSPDDTEPAKITPSPSASRAKSCQDLTRLANLTSVHYRF